VPGFQLEKQKQSRGGRPRKRAIRVNRRVLQTIRREAFYKRILEARSVGREQLQARGARLTEKAALEAGIRSNPAKFGVPTSDLKIRKTAAVWAKRLSKANKLLRESSKT
jgi:hypothetical protein